MLVLYGSETGNAQDVAGMLTAYMKQALTDCCALPMDCVTLDELASEEHVIYVCSTTGQGDVPQGMQQTWKSLLRKSLSNSLLSKMQYAVFGLGDSGYVQFNVVAKKLDRRLQQLGAKRMIALGLGDDQDSGGYETALDPWIDALFAALPSVVATGVPPRPSMSPSEPPKFYVRTSATATDTPATTCNGEQAAEAPGGHFRAACRASAAFSVLGGVAAGSQPWSALSRLSASPSKQDGQQKDCSSATRSIESPFWAEVVKTKRLTAADHWQVVQHIELNIEGSGMQYSPGDLLVTLPEVAHSAGTELLQCMGIPADATLSVGINMSALPQRLQPQDAEAEGPHSAEFSAPALAVATGVLDVAGAPPRRRLFAALAALATEDVEKKRLLHFASPEGRDDLATYCSRERRTLLEILKDFPSAKLPMAQLLQAAPLLKPRQFSISSSPAAHPGRVHVTVAEVDYRTPFRRHIKGVCSTWLAALQVGAKIPVWIEKGALALPPPGVPLICVGPGTGVAPFRSFLHERAALLKSGVAVAPSVLVFGCRNEAKDFLYAEEWRELMRLGVLKSECGLLCAFSRDQPSKRYVQHCIREKKGFLWLTLREENGSVFVAGSAEKMPEAVAVAFVDVISAGLLCPETEAKALQRRLEAAKRYCVEAWG